MAKKRGLDIKALMLAHVEKVVCVIIAICFVVLLWGAVSREGVPSGIEPADIQGVAAQAKANVVRTKWDDFSSKPQMRNFAEESGWYTVPFKAYEITTAWNPENFHKQGLRNDPKYFGMTDLEAHYDQGPMALYSAEYLKRKFGQDGAIPKEVQDMIDRARVKPPLPPRVSLEDNPNRLVDEEGAMVKIDFPGGPVEENEVAEGARWIMVTGLLPVEKQLDSFEDMFRNAVGFEQKNDLPLYFGYEVERADVTGGVAPEWKPYDKVSSRSLLITTLRWPRNKKSEIIDSKYADPIFTCPLGPRVLELWTDRDKHSKVPLKRTGPREVEAGALMEDQLDGLGQDGVEDLETLLSGTRKRSDDPVEEQRVPVKMVRYFDFNVTPGREYQYRFRAVLRDPNYIREQIDGADGLRRVELKLLEQPVIARINQKRQELEKEGFSPELVERLMQITYTPWSDPTPAVKVPPESFVLAVNAKPAPPGKYNEEPEATILTTEYDSELGFEMGGQTTMQRGSMGNFTVDRMRILNLDYNSVDFRPKTFDPNRIMLDMRGGEQLGDSSLFSPGELLMLDLGKGKAVVNSEIEDAQGVREFHERQKKMDEFIPSNKPTPGGGAGPLDIDILN